MSALTFVNLRGETVSLDDLATRHKPAPKPVKDYLRRVQHRENAQQSDGFVVSGYSPAQIESGKLDHANSDDADTKPWDIEVFMKKNKPKRVRSKPYEIASAADECAELARKAGWLRVGVEEIMKG